MFGETKAHDGVDDGLYELTIGEMHEGTAAREAWHEERRLALEARKELEFRLLSKLHFTEQHCLELDQVRATREINALVAQLQYEDKIVTVQSYNELVAMSVKMMPAMLAGNIEETKREMQEKAEAIRKKTHSTCAN